MEYAWDKPHDVTDKCMHPWADGTEMVRIFRVSDDAHLSGCLHRDMRRSTYDAIRKVQQDPEGAAAELKLLADSLISLSNSFQTEASNIRRQILDAAKAFDDVPCYRVRFLNGFEKDMGTKLHDREILEVLKVL